MPAAGAGFDSASNRDRDPPELPRARALWAANRFDDAAALFAQIADSNPGNVPALVDAARALGHRHEIHRAEGWLASLRSIAADRPDLLFLLGQTYRMILREEQALDCFEKFIAGPGRNHADAHFEIAVLQERRHRDDAAEAAAARVLQIDPQYAEARIIQARLFRRRGESAKAAATLQKILRQGPAHPFTRAQTHAALADLADKSEDYAGAVASMEKAKEILRAHAAIPLRDSAVVMGNLSAFGNALTAADFQRWIAHGPELQGPAGPARVAHLTSFPRSGTTLLENILDAHPDIISSEEREVFGRDIMNGLWREPHEPAPPTVAAFDSIPVEKLQRLRARYLAAMQEALNEPIARRWHIDKNPTHTLLIPGIVRLFPETKFLIALRDPRDVIVSCYFQYLPLNANSVSFLSWESTAQRYAQDMGLWLKFRDLLPPDRWAEIRYESLVAHLPSEAQRALTLLNLPWDEKVLGYRDRLQTKTVHSPTYADVARPLTNKAIGRWKNYASHLEPHLPVIESVMRGFGYD